jgi:hypothetical protein
MVGRKRVWVGSRGVGNPVGTGVGVAAGSGVGVEAGKPVAVGIGVPAGFAVKALQAANSTTRNETMTALLMTFMFSYTWLIMKNVPLE